MQLLSASWCGDCKVQEIWDSTCVISDFKSWFCGEFCKNKEKLWWTALWQTVTRLVKVIIDIIFVFQRRKTPREQNGFWFKGKILPLNCMAHPAMIWAQRLQSANQLPWIRCVDLRIIMLQLRLRVESSFWWILTPHIVFTGWKLIEFYPQSEESYITW